MSGTAHTGTFWGDLWRCLCLPRILHTSGYKKGKWRWGFNKGTKGYGGSSLQKTQRKMCWSILEKRARMSCLYLLLDGNSALRVELQLHSSVPVLNMSTCYHELVCVGYNISFIITIFQHTAIKHKVELRCCGTDCLRSSLHMMKIASFVRLWLISAILGW